MPSGYLRKVCYNTFVYLKLDENRGDIMDRKIIEKFVLSALIIMGCSAVGGLIWANSQNQLQQQVAVEEAEKEPGVESDAYILAKGDYSNLEELLTDVDKPVYDRYTLKQRQGKGLPTMLPPLAVYNKEKVAYLTFDDGPDNKNTLAILDILKANGIHGTFYVTGKMCEENPTVLKRIFEEGHAIGNHSYDHDYKRLYQSKDSFLAEMQQTDDIIFNILGVRPFIIRAPGGTVGMFSADYYPALTEAGYVEHDWNVSSEDATPKRPNAARQIKFVDSMTKGDLKDNMALVLMHCCGGKEETVKALQGIIDVLKAKGYRFGVVTPITPQPW